MKRSIPLWPLLAAAALSVAVPAAAQDKVVNVYSSRHYQTDEKLYRDFTKATGIQVRLIEGKEDALIERIRNEGANSPADVLITVDAGRLWRAEELDLFAPVKSQVLDNRLPASFRHPEGKWFGFSYRARVIVYNKDKVKPGEITSYADLADPKWKGRICVRSSSNIYNLSLLAALIHHWGEDKARQWAKDVKENLARDPKGGDTDQIKAVAAGECDVAISNHYYYVRLMNSDKPEDKKVVEKVALVWPDQNGNGTHVNVSGAGLIKTAPHKQAAIKFLEYLASDQAQAYFAAGNNEWPVVSSAAYRNPALASLGKFKADSLNVSVLGKNQALAQKIYDQVGWK
ncbi:Fe(3+) ABC transporter substrate-binding protein [Pelomicrobium methylotrophicum]|uniref:Fe(3+) ABC transporter substrate-binding protein n=1 Tax=Pelomicrobium methylotrophicum TaxID=2602750 RepID=A0A5C7EUM9_9PROT|nr:Fe(3+) ABC transporter substrate-binding protein [Pelomicrobium methylotrophicum]TXF11743.1 Fe(3+) ABC transporter substrate-binding protein [Pelomicrobium methylotrophicum]